MKELIKKEILAVLGIAGPSGGIAISLSEVETWLRISSLLVGIVIGCFSVRSLWLTIQRKKLKLKQEQEPDTDI